MFLSNNSDYLHFNHGGSSLGNSTDSTSFFGNVNSSFFRMDRGSIGSIADLDLGSPAQAAAPALLFHSSRSSVTMEPPVPSCFSSATSGNIIPANAGPQIVSAPKKTMAQSYSQSMPMNLSTVNLPPGMPNISPHMDGLAGSLNTSLTVSGKLTGSLLGTTFRNLCASLARNADFAEVHRYLEDIATMDESLPAGIALSPQDAFLTSNLELNGGQDLEQIIEYRLSMHPTLLSTPERKSETDNLLSEFRALIRMHTAKLAVTKKKSLEALRYLMDKRSDVCPVTSGERIIKERALEQTFRDSLNKILAQASTSIAEHCAHAAQKYAKEDHKRLSLQKCPSSGQRQSSTEVSSFIPSHGNRRLQNAQADLQTQRAFFSNRYAPSVDSAIYEGERDFEDDSFHASNSNREASGATMKNKKLPRAAVEYFKKWMVDHYEHPYPSDDEKEQFTVTYQISLAQVNNWFINARVRTWRPLMKEMGVADKQAHRAQPSEELCRELHDRLYGQPVSSGSASTSTTTALNS
jgi:hypothetical protein